MMQNGVTLHENSKRETYAFNAKCSTKTNHSNPENRQFRARADLKKTPVIWGFRKCPAFQSRPVFSKTKRKRILHLLLDITVLISPRHCADVALRSSESYGRILDV